MIGFILFLTTLFGTRDIHVHPRGYWYGNDVYQEHQFDPYLAQTLAQFFLHERASSVADFGCGMGDYVKVLRAFRVPCEGYDGNPETAHLLGEGGHVADLSQPLHLGRKFDWILSLEVAEHIPKQFEKAFIENLHAHNVRGIVLSWAVPGQGGYGHFNEQSNEYVKKLMAEYGYSNDVFAEQELRRRSVLPWFRNTVMVFRNQGAPTR